MSAPAVEARKVFRQLLRVTGRQLGGAEWATYIRCQFRTQHEDPASALRLAEDWHMLANNIEHHKALLRSYNIGLDDDERNKQMVEAVARRIGFALPKHGETGRAPRTKPSKAPKDTDRIQTDMRTEPLQ